MTIIMDFQARRPVPLHFLRHMTVMRKTSDLAHGKIGGVYCVDFMSFHALVDYSAWFLGIVAGIGRARNVRQPGWGRCVTRCS